MKSGRCVMLMKGVVVREDAAGSIRLGTKGVVCRGISF